MGALLHEHELVGASTKGNEGEGGKDELYFVFQNQQTYVGDYVEGTTFQNSVSHNV